MTNKLQRVVALERSPVNETERLLYSGAMNVPPYPRTIKEKDGIGVFDVQCFETVRPIMAELQTSGVLNEVALDNLRLYVDGVTVSRRVLVQSIYR